MDTPEGIRWFSKLDSNAAYWQIKTDAEDREKTDLQPNMAY
jgi:hypothetical protein